MAFHLSLNFEQTEESCIMKNVTSRVVNLTPLLILFLCSLALTKASSAASYVNVFVNLPAYSAQDTSSPTMDNTPTTLDSLTNFQTNSNTMLSSGLPSSAHLLLLKQEGVVRVIDLIPGNRSEEISIVNELGMQYHNIPVAWTNPQVSDFLNYSAYMSLHRPEEGKVLTHCKLNWRGAVFTYLYRITVLSEDEKTAKQDLLAIWQPNSTWFAFMNKVIEHHNAANQTRIVTTVEPNLDAQNQ